jgi:hypothetical protein
MSLRWIDEAAGSLCAEMSGIGVPSVLQSETLDEYLAGEFGRIGAGGGAGGTAGSARLDLGGGGPATCIETAGGVGNARLDAPLAEGFGSGRRCGRAASGCSWDPEPVARDPDCSEPS